jgi:ATP-binding cassette, subfamily B, bacterial PglK
MKFYKTLFFFYKEISLNIFFKILINFIFIFLIIASELLFLGSFFVLLNQSNDSQVFSIFFYNFELYFSNLFENYSVTEIYILLLIFFLISKNLLTIVQNFYFNKFIFKLSINKSSQILNFYMNKSYDSFSKKEISIYIKQIIRDVENVFVGIFGLFISLISELLYVIILLYFTSSLVNFRPSLEVLLIFIIASIILYLLFIASKKYGEIRAISEINVFKSLTDTLNLFKEIKILKNQKEFVYRYKNYLKTYYNTKNKASIIHITPKFMFELLLLIFFFILFKSESGQLSINEFIIKYSVFALAMFRLIPSFSRLSSYFTMILYNLHSISYIEKDLKTNLIIPKKIEGKKSLNAIKLKNIYLNYLNKDNFKFNKKNKVFNINLEKNKIYGIYGKSGSGKTSLLNLLAGFINPNNGSIEVNSKKQDFNELTNLYKIGYSSQTTTILDENILFNSTLKYENSRKDIKKLKILLNQFGLKKFSHQKFFSKHELATIKSMSGGEKQRVGFIRTIMNNPDLILLDEPTSSLDKENEIKLFQFLSSIKNNKIIVVATHNKDHVKYFDKIITL